MSARATTIMVIISMVCTTMVEVSSLGSMSTIAVSYGENGPAFCALNSDGTHSVSCFGADVSIVYGSPHRLAFLGLTAGDSFICGLLLDERQPYCWGSNIYVKMGVPQPIQEGAAYTSLSAGDHHVCGLRKPVVGMPSSVDCWGYNMTASTSFTGGIAAISAGSVFNCALFARNRTAHCWGDETTSGVISLLPRSIGFSSIAAGGFHVCGIMSNSRVFCWGRSMGVQESALSAPMDSMITVVGGKFHACGVKSLDRGVRCWGLKVNHSVPPPGKAHMFAIAAGDYFTCGVLAEKSLRPVCWGAGGPWSPPIAVSPGICNTTDECGSGTFEFGGDGNVCRPENSRICIPCSSGCAGSEHEVTACNSTVGQQCALNCNGCGSKPKPARFLPVFVAEMAFAVLLVSAVSIVAFLYVRYRLRNCRCSGNASRGSRSCKDVSVRIRPEMEELKIRRARMFTYRELERATGGFKEESQVGKGSFSCVFKGVLQDGTVVAVKRAMCSSSVKKSSKEFHTELDLLSRLNHAHLLNLLGYCEEGGERLLVYEFMAHGSLYQHLHGKDPMLKKRLDWVRRVTIAVQAARGIEYLHGYACPPVIHRDIKSSNILIDEEHNARVSDFGLSLLGPTDGSAPLSELPAGTLGYLDPEYYRLHYLTTKSDVYSFGVLLLEILSGRKAIDMQFEEGNIVEWAVPLIRGEDIATLLDPILPSPPEIEALNKIASIASKCVRMRGKDRPSMDKVTTALERALAMLMGSPCNEQPILPTEVVLGSSRMHKKASQRSSNQSCSESEMVDAVEDQRIEYRAPSWITFPSVTSSQRVSDGGDMDVKASEGRNLGNGGAGDSLRCLEEEIGPASPQEDLYLQHNF